VIYAVEKCGYRHIDCAFCYANEDPVGEALRDLFARGVVKREELWITSKLWNTFHHKEDVERGLKLTLKSLQIDYLDLYLIHWPAAFVRKSPDSRPIESVPLDELDQWRFPKIPPGTGAYEFDKVPLIETWHAMEDLVSKKLVRFIGGSNFTINHLENLKYSDAKIKPLVNQIEFHLYMQQGPLIDYCQKEGILVTGYSTLGSGGPLLKDEVLVKVAGEVGKTVAQTELKFLQQAAPGVILLAKSVTPDRIAENIQLDGWSLTPAQVEALRKRQRNQRACDVRILWKTDVLGDGWW